MIGWIRNIVLILAVLTVIYAVLTFIARFKQRDKLKGEYAASDKIIPQEEFVAKGLKTYQKSYRPKMILFVYLIPFAVLCGLIYLAQNT